MNYHTYPRSPNPYFFIKVLKNLQKNLYFLNSNDILLFKQLLDQWPHKCPIKSGSIIQNYGCLDLDQKEIFTDPEHLFIACMPIY